MLVTVELVKELMFELDQSEPVSIQFELATELADRELWSVVLLSPKYVVQPDVVYGLITSAGDRFVDSNSNQFIAIS